MDTPSFRCRIVDIDYYAAQAIKDLDVCYSSFRSSPSEKVPVIRIFGATPAGQKTCLHVHGVFPYLYVPCHATDPSDRYLHQLAVSIDQALQVSLGASSKHAQHVFKITLVEGVPFYGYHGSEELFLKVYLYNPGLIKRLADLLVAGAVMNDILQPHEAHIPFVLQFMIDYNLYGMNHICLSAIKFRLGEGHTSLQPGITFSDSCPSSPRASLSQTFWSVKTLPNDMVLPLPRLSTCELEVDCLAQDILNRHEVSLATGGYPGLAALWDEERSRRLGLTQSVPVTPPLSPDRTETPILQWEEWQWEELNRALKERFAATSPGRDDTVESLARHTLSQSCEVELHQVTSQPSPTEGLTPTEELAGDQSVCDKEVVLRSVELTQRLSPNAICQSTDEEVLRLLEELAAGPSSVHPSQTAPHESTAQRLAAQLRRSISTASASQSNGASGGPRSSPESGVSGAALGSDEELFSSSPRGEASHFLKFEAQGATVVDAAAPGVHLEPRGAGSMLEGEGSGSMVYDMSEASFMQFDSTQPPSQSRSGSISMTTPTRKLSQTGSASCVGLIPHHQKKCVLRLCAEGDEGEAMEDPVLGGVMVNEEEEEEEEDVESFLMSQPVWDDVDPTSVPRKVMESSQHGPQGDKGEEGPSRRRKISPSSIVQLDGAGSLPSDKDTSQDSTSGKKLSLKRRHSDTVLASPRVRVLEKPKRGLQLHTHQQEDMPKKSLQPSPTPHTYQQEDMPKKSLQPSPTPHTYQQDDMPKKSLQPSPTLHTHQQDDMPVIVIPAPKRHKLSPVTEGSPHTASEQLPAWSEPATSQPRGPLYRALVTKALLSSPTVVVQRLSKRELDKHLRGMGRRSPSAAVSEHGSLELFSDRSLSVGPLEHSVAEDATAGIDPVSLWEGSLGGLEVRGESRWREGGSGWSRKTRAKKKRGRMRGIRYGRRVQLEEEIETEVGEEVFVAKEMAAPPKESSSSLARSLDIKYEGNPTPREVTAVRLQSEAALKGEVAPCTVCEDESHVVVVERSLGDVGALGRLCIDMVVADVNEGSASVLAGNASDDIASMAPGDDIGGGVPIAPSNNIGGGTSIAPSDNIGGGASMAPSDDIGGGVPMAPNDDIGCNVTMAPSDDIGCNVLMSPNMAVDQADILEGEIAEGIPCQVSADAPDVTSSDNDFHLAYTSTSEGDSEYMEEGGDPPSPWEGPTTIQRTHVTLMSHPMGSGGGMSPNISCRIPDQGGGGGVEAGQSSGEGGGGVEAGRSSGEGGGGVEARRSSCVGMSEAFDDLLGSPSPEVKSKLARVDELALPLQGPVGIFEYATLPPSVDELMRSARELGLPRAINTKPFCGNPGDVQPAKEVGSRLLKVRSHMPYDLHDFEPAYLCGTGARFSSTGLAHWRLILAMVSSRSGDILIPPPCRRVEGEGLGTFYSAEDHRRDVELRSHFFGDGIIAATPARPPPSREDVLEWSKGLLPETKVEEETVGANAAGGRSCLDLVGGKGERDMSGDGVDEERVAGGRRGEGRGDGGEGRCDGGVEKRRDDGEKEAGPSCGGCGYEEGSSTTVAMLGESPAQGAAAAAVLSVARRHNDSGSVRGSPDHLSSLARGLDSPSVVRGGGEGASVRVGDSLPLPLHSTPALCRHESVGGRSDQTVVVSGTTETGQSVEEEVTAKDVWVELGAGGSKSAAKMKRGRRKLPFLPEVKRDASLLEGPSPENSFGFKMSESVLGTSDTPEVQHLTTMSLEVHVQTRGKLTPDPSMDPVVAIFFYIHNDWPHPSNDANTRHGVLAIDLGSCELKTLPKSSPRKKGPLANRGGGGGGSPAKGSPAKGISSKISPAKSSPLKKSPIKVKSPDAATVSASASKEEGIATSGDESRNQRGQYLHHCGVPEHLEVSYATSELDLFQKLVELVRNSDPDLLVGYEVEALSWGYLASRAASLNINLSNELSRVPRGTWKNGDGEAPVKADVKRGKAGFTLHVVGRILINIWRVMRHELALNSYTFESLAFHVLYTRVPHFSFQTLTSWYMEPTTLSRVVDYYSLRCLGNFQILEKLNVIGRTSEFARLYGIEFESVLSRGSQYRVESMLLRLAKPSNFIAISPSVQQRARMAAPECLPLILEPESRFYADPVLVLDFQSLYPSMMIAYNYCYSTCLGRVRHLAHHEEFTFGASTLRVPSPTLKKLKDHVTISPNGVVFVKPHVRKGVVPCMVEEILNTRIMVKQSMKLYKENKSLLRIMDARQLGLKMIINVTYGYTGATYSGRMPCVEIADSIVRKARETLEQAIHLVNSTPEWGAKVVYGDTDSMFVLLKGASKEEAFRIGKEIGDRVTALNPKPVKLKFEKTKKRYVGFSYESLEQKEPNFDAKGIETVRRDGCPAVAKVLGKSLRLLFTTRDVSVVKSYVQSQCSKLLEGRANIQDYTLAREYRGMSNYRPGACVPALELSRQNLLRDPCSEPRVKERVPYVVVYGSPGLPLIQLIRRPEEILQDTSLRLNGVYYITKLILPALNRAFSLIGVDVWKWYADMPRVFRAEVQQNSKKNTIGQYFATMHCVSCGELTMETMCTKCREEPQVSTVRLCAKMSASEKDYYSLSELCHNCVSDRSPDYSSACTSLDCPVLYVVNRANRKMAEATSNAAVLYDTFPPQVLEF